MFLENKIVFLFNKLFISFLKDLKENTTNDEVKSAIKKNYKVIDKSSPDHLVNFWLNWAPHMHDAEKASDVEVLKDVKLEMVLPDIKDNIFWNHIYTLLVFSYLYQEVSKEDIVVVDKEEEDADADAEAESENLDEILESVITENDKETQMETLFNKVVDVIRSLQKNEDANEEIDEILDDDIRTMLKKIKVVEDEKKKESPAFDFGNIFGAEMGTSKIANLAKEISDEIDVSKINIEKPEDIAKLMDFSSGNNVMGDIIKKVSTKISDKIQNGELKQDDLLGEAMSMMGMMGKAGNNPLAAMFNNPMMSEMMKSMKKGKMPSTRQDVFKNASARDRLRKKLAEKQASGK
jgi:hypothetical protein